MAKVNMKEQLVKDYEAKIAEVNATITNGTNAEVEARLSELSNIEKQYLIIHEKDVFAACSDVHAALVQHDFTTISHQKESDNGVLTGVVATTKTVVIDLRKFCEFKGLPMGWYYEMQALNKRLTLKVAQEIGVSAQEMKRIDDSYAMDKLASEIELGKTPTSNTQCVKHMQTVLDELSPNEGKVNGHDLAYVWLTYAKRNNKKALSVACSRHSALQTVLTDVFHRVVTDNSYGVEYQESKERKTPETVTDAPKTDSKVKGSKSKSKSDNEAEGVKPEAENKAE